jgi:hypothetical protein
MSFLDYNSTSEKYWNSLQWKLIKKYLIGKTKKCQRCGETNIKELIVHHLCYDRYPFENELDFLVLCRKCHKEIHDEDSKVVYTAYKNQNIESKKDEFNLPEIAKDVIPKHRFCDLCDDENVHVCDTFDIKDITLYNKGKTQPAYSNFYIPLGKEYLKICCNCLNRLNLTKPNYWDISKNPQLAVALLRKEDKTLSKKKGVKRKEVKKDGSQNKPQKTL